jgi:hypothetical protein
VARKPKALPPEAQEALDHILCKRVEHAAELAAMPAQERRERIARKAEPHTAVWFDDRDRVSLGKRWGVTIPRLRAPKEKKGIQARWDAREKKRSDHTRAKDARAKRKAAISDAKLLQALRGLDEDEDGRKRPVLELHALLRERGIRVSRPRIAKARQRL